jgi:hypothetical protein
VPGQQHSDKQLHDAEFPDVAEWGDKPMAGAYAPGSKAMIGGQEVDLSEVPDVLGGDASINAPSGAARPAPSKDAGRSAGTTGPARSAEG